MEPLRQDENAASLRLWLYVGKHYALWLALVLLGLLALIYLFEAAELLRRAAIRPEIASSQMLFLALLKMPGTVQTLLPFVILFSSMLSLWQLNRSSELVVMRALGLSAWQFLLPIFALTLALGLCNLCLVNPLSALSNAAFAKMEAQTLKRQTQTLSISGAGLWLRQDHAGGQDLLHAEHNKTDTNAAAKTEQALVLKPVTVFRFDKKGKLLSRLDAEEAALEKGQWLLRNVWENKPDKPALFFAQRKLMTDLSLEKITGSLKAPSAVSFWDMPQFLSALHAIGFPANAHELYFYSLLTQPLLLLAMSLFAAAFSLRLLRRGGTLSSALAGIALGILAFAGSDIILALGESQTLPLFLAALAGPLCAMMIGLAILLHLEDG